MEAERFLIINPLIYDKKDKYVWINDTFQEHREAQRLFDYLMKKNIYIRGFATDAESLISLKMYHKKIYDIETLNKTHSAVFFDSYFGCSDIDLSGKAHRARVINLHMKGESVVIWGSGITGERVYKILTDYGIPVTFFVDSDKRLEGKKKCGLPIYMPDKIDILKEDVIVIEALEKWRELDRTICEKYKKRYYFSLNSDEISKEVTFNDGVGEKKLFCLKNFALFSHFAGKKVYIYGLGGAEREFTKYLELLDFSFAGFLIDETDDFDEECKEYPIKYVEEILNEEGWYIWAYDRERAKRLDELGLSYFKDYFVKEYTWDITRKRKNILDINLGHNYLSDSKYPGFEVYGEERKENFKIVVLGNSTTDGVSHPFKSWPQLLYEQLGGRSITVYNGGVWGYTSGIELIKLIRDVLWMTPDMIIVCDGINDLNNNVQYPFKNVYLDKAFEYAKLHLKENDNNFDRNDIPLCRGIESQYDRFENWLTNIQTMYAVAKERNICFFSFCQPVLTSKKVMTVREKNMLLSIKSTAISLQIREAFRNRMEQMSCKPQYMYDLSNIFDEEDDVYMDICHVWEKGNRIIAEEIKKVILPELPDWLQEGKEYYPLDEGRKRNG